MSDLSQSAPAALEPFGLTERAAQRIAALLHDHPEDAGKFMRVAVEGGGCSGFQYVFAFDDTRDDDDLAFTTDGIEVVIDPVSLDLVRGGQLDYIEELIGSYFQVINPNAASSCGCGTSFSIQVPPSG